jgi:hypothetical protein
LSFVVRGSAFSVHVIRWEFRMSDTPEPVTLRSLRRLLLVLVTVVLLATAIDLFLIGHYEEPWQLLPLVTIAAALAVSAWVAGSRSPWSVATFRIAMLLLVVTGVLGIGMHFNGSREFQIEMDPALSGWALFIKAMRAKAPPTLAPGAMAQAGLFGLLYTYRHPALRRGERVSTHRDQEP